MAAVDLTLDDWFRAIEIAEAVGITVDEALMQIAKEKG